MRIGNVRMGFASNSSSTHSIIVAGTGEGSPERSEFGWEKFLLSRPTHKAAYLAQTFYEAAQGQLDDFVIKAIVRSLFGEVFSDFDFDGYVDHQSRFTIPLTQEGKLAVEFYTEMAQALMKDNTAHIQGGNDNGDSPDGEKHGSWMFYYPMCDNLSEKYRCRKDGTTWTIFDTSSGLKFRLDFTKEGNKVDVDFKTSTPELIDIKITDYCPSQCSFCYQNSTKEGKHASFEKIHELILSLSWSGRIKPFEIALGGGEPTMHPQFADILKLCHDQGIIPNFTTNSEHWYQDAEIREAVMRYVGGYARSVHHDYGVERVIRMHDALDLLYSGEQYRNPKLNLHYILDAHPMKDFNDVLKRVGRTTPLIVLGYKEQGRAKKRPYINKGWLDTFFKMCICGQNMEHMSLGIDTLLAQQYEGEIKANGINERLYYLNEGKHSLYIDAVNQTFGKSSYCGEYLPYKSMKDILDAFKGWSAT